MNAIATRIRWLAWLSIPFLVAAAVPPAPTVESALAAANALFNAQQHAEAKAAFGRVLALSPDNAEANFRLGLYACDAGEWEKALAYEAKALAADPKNAKYQYGWGAANGIAALKSGLLSKLGYAHKCLAAYQRAAELEPSNPQYHYALFSYYTQAPGFAGGDKDLALVQAAEIKKLDPQLGRQAYAEWYLRQHKPDLAFQEYEVVLRESPNDYVALYHVGLVALFSGQRLEQGLAALRHCLALDVPKGSPSHANVHWRIGSLLEKTGQAELARTEYAAALKENPNFRPAISAMAKLAPGARH